MFQTLAKSVCAELGKKGEYPGVDESGEQGDGGRVKTDAHLDLPIRTSRFGSSKGRVWRGH